MTKCNAISDDGEPCVLDADHGAGGVLHQARGERAHKGWGWTFPVWSDEAVKFGTFNRQAARRRFDEDERGYRYGVSEQYTKLCEVPDRPGRFTTKGAKPSSFVVTDRFGVRDVEEKFRSRKKAEARAEELNIADLELDLNPAYAERRQRLKDLGETFWVRYGEGHPEARWPKEPGRYAVEEYSERYSESFWTTEDSLEEIEDSIKAGDVERVVDLDTGENVPFQVYVEVGV